MAEPIIRVENLGKKYQIKHKEGRQRYKALRDVLADSAKTMFNLFKAKSGTKSSSTEDFWALKDVSFDIQQGDVVGIIGRNGAGKSTLLKILSRITEPTSGRVTLNGRVASLLEVGTGFHPELTGRENIYLNGSILGMSRSEIARKFDEIVAFAEVEKFLDTPVKRYSSGMYVRLAFAVAAHLEPEILVVDEVLAVGDAQFQKKCLGKMGEVAKGGRTVLFVSHNMATVSGLCKRGIWLQKGSVIKLGMARDIVADYLNHTAEHAERINDLNSMSRIDDYGQLVRLMNIEWEPNVPIAFSSTIKFTIEFEAKSSAVGIAIGLGISMIDGTRFLTYESDLSSNRRTCIANSRERVELAIDRVMLSPGSYLIDIGIRSGDSVLLDYLPFIGKIEIIGDEKTPTNVLQHENVGLRLSGHWNWCDNKTEFH